MAISSEAEVGGRKFTIETGDFAKKASGSATVRYGDTMVLVTVCYNPEPRPDVNFLPLTVDYEERLYAAGKIPGSYIRREGRPSEDAVLAGRLSDRVLRPLLPKTWYRDIQIVVTVLSVDQENDPDVLAVIGGSTALSLSEIPFAGPASAVRVGYINGEYVVNPTLPSLASSALNLVVASSSDMILMVQGEAAGIPDSVLLEAIKTGDRANKQIISLQEDLVRRAGKPKLGVSEDRVDPELVARVAVARDRISQALDKGPAERNEALDTVREEIVNRLAASSCVEDLDEAFDEVLRKEVRRKMLRNQRLDGRRIEELRPMSCRVGVIPRVHGSGLFTRGDTQVLSITTLGSTRREQQLDGLGIEETKRFIHHYNFPPYSTGEVRRIGSPSRREVGHGALVENALQAVVPSDDDYPYTIRLVSEVLASNGSTSMASVCAGSLSLMDAGVPVREAVAGVAMGLVVEGNTHVVLTDIQGLEDSYGDMDFKVAGTASGITAVQMDTKLKGLTLDILEEALDRARTARILILDVMNRTISQSRPEVSIHAPRMYRIKINPDKVGAVIGSGGKTVKSIIAETRTTIDIEDDGTVLIGSPDADSAEKAIEMIEALVNDPVIGRNYAGKVIRTMPYGAFVEILPGKEGLLHISELAPYRVRRVEDEVRAGDEILVKVVDLDSAGRITLSRKAVLEAAGETQATPSSSRAS